MHSVTKTWNLLINKQQQHGNNTVIIWDLLSDDGELRHDRLHVGVSGSLVLAERRIEQVHFFQRQAVLCTLFTNLITTRSFYLLAFVICHL